MNVDKYEAEKPQDMFEDQEDQFIPEVDDAPLPVPPQERRLITQPYDLSVRNIVDQINEKSLETQPSFQRGYVWDEIRASRLIESLLMNIPIPVCYFAEEESGKYTVIDGHQRLYSIWRYVSNHFSLRGLRTLPDLNEKYFKDLKERDQRIILGRSIRCISITQESDPEIRFEVFERLNSGAMQVTDQEIRNAVYRGAFNDLIKVLAQSEIWLKVLNKKQLDKRMRDEELILRFFAVNDTYLSYQAPLRTFLNNYAASKSIMKVHGKIIRIKPSDEEKKRLIELFHQTMAKAEAVFGNHAFRAYIDGAWEGQVNRALFDAVTLVLAHISLDQVLSNAAKIEKILQELCQDPAFRQAISGSKAHRTSFVTRIKMFSEAMAGIGLDTGIHLTFPDDD